MFSNVLLKCLNYHCCADLFVTLIGSGIRCIRDRVASFSEYQGFAGEWTQLQQHGRLQDLFQGVFEELPDRGVSWKVHFWQSPHTCSGR